MTVGCLRFAARQQADSLLMRSRSGAYGGGQLLVSALQVCMRVQLP